MWHRKQQAEQAGCGRFSLIFIDRKKERKKGRKEGLKGERKNDVCLLTFHHLFVFSLSLRSFLSLFFSLHALKTLLEKNSMPPMLLISSYPAQ